MQLIKLLCMKCGIQFEGAGQFVDECPGCGEGNWSNPN